MRHLDHSVAVGLACLACSAFAACAKAVPPDAQDLVTQAIDTSVSLAGWTKTHPRDIVSLAAPTGAANESFCRASTAPAELAGATVTRYALSYIPGAPTGEVVPSDTAHFAGTACMLSAVWTVRDVSDTAAAKQFADTLERSLAAQLGPGRVGAEITGLGTGSWQVARTWTVGATRVVMGIAPANNYRDLETGAVTHSGPRVIVVAYAPHSGLSPVPPGVAPAVYGQSHFFLRGVDRELETQWVDSALAQPGVPTNVVSNLKRVLAQTRTAKATGAMRTAALDSVLVRAVVATRDSVPHLAPGARAATLFAADFAIEAYAGTLDADTTSNDTRTHRTLRAAGVDYVDARAPVFVYTRPWLWQAYHTDSLSPAGQLAFLELLEHGWTTRPDCADGRSGYERVITEGEAAIVAGNTDPLVQLLIGEAYRDIYALAHGAGGSYARASDFTEKAEPARAQAIAHLTLALRTLPDSPARQAAWDDEVRLVLGVHAEPSFFCFY